MIHRMCGMGLRASWWCGVTALLLALSASASAGDEETLLLRSPAISKDQLAFVYAGDLWVTDRDGTNPRRLTSHPADERSPRFSPDGQQIAFNAQYGDNLDVYVISSAGGQPRRLTWHPGDDVVNGWTAKGKQVTFASARETNHGRSAQLYHVGLEGRMPVKQMEARYFQGAWDARGERLAYIAHGSGYNGLFGGSAGWRGYRGGTTPSVMILRPSKKALTKVPGGGGRSTDFNPLWYGDLVLFLSDRGADKVFNLYSFDTRSGDVEMLTAETDWDVRAADHYEGTVVYEAGGRLKLLDLASGEVTPLRISINPDLPQTLPQWKSAMGALESMALSPTGKRALLTARGEVFSVPTDEGSTRNLSLTGDVREYTALWSPDGQQVAYVADEGGIQFLIIEDQKGSARPRKLALGTDFYFLLEWAGDGDHIIFHDNHLGLFALNVPSGDSVVIDHAARRDSFQVSTSGDGRWLAYTIEQPNFNRDLKLWNFERAEAVTVSDGMADVGSPAFSGDGKYLYFTASTNSGPAQVGLDMSSQERPYRAGLYALVLASGGVSPLLPSTGDEDAPAADDDASTTARSEGDAAKAEAEGSDSTLIDPAGLAQRIVALPVAEANYDNLKVADDGSLLYLRRGQPGSETLPPGQTPAAATTLMRFDFEEREAEAVTAGLVDYVLSADRKHLLIRRADDSLATAEVAAELDVKVLDTSDVKAFIDPRQEWAYIFHDVWRMEWNYFYDPAHHGLNWHLVNGKYAALLPHVGRREDLNELMVQMIAELQVGHNRVSGGDVHKGAGTSTGLLGADLAVENNRLRIKRIYSGERWNPFLRGPLAAPGLDVAVGDYILGVNGRRLGSFDNLFALLEGTVGSQVTLTLSNRPAGGEKRDVVVEPVESERMIRLWGWVEDNRRAVSEATDGRVGYVYLPNTAGAGFTLFNRMFFAQVDREAMIIDERSNGGGQAANYITDVLSRRYLSSWRDRDGLLFQTPGGAMYGPTLMMIDQDAGSGGDFLPYAFRHLGIGKLLGTRTWGGLIGIYANPQLMDGGTVTVPFFRFIDSAGKWSVENEGVAPDIEVALDPVTTNAGRDSQLEAAIADILRQLESASSPVPEEAPAYPTEPGQ
jgi:tricorn protease